MSSYQNRKSHCGDKTVVRSSYLHKAISYTGKMTSLYWIGAQDHMPGLSLAQVIVYGISNDKFLLKQMLIYFQLNIFKQTPFEFNRNTFVPFPIYF